MDKADYTQGLTDLLGQYLRFDHRSMSEGSTNVAAYCPFHGGGMERSPSFYLYIGPTTGGKFTGDGYCHTCSRGWSLGTLLAELGVDRHTAAGILEVFGTEAAKRKKARARLLTGNKNDGIEYVGHILPEYVLGLYEYKPKALIEEGFPAALIRKHEIGFDRGARRITFPIRNHLGQLVGISGRTVIGEEPRYKMYKSEFSGIISGYKFDKAHVLYGLDKFIKNEERNNPFLVLCEGFKAKLWTELHGFEYSVCSMGTAVSEQQMELLERAGGRLVIFFDNDLPGVRGTYRLAKQLKRVSSTIPLIANYNAILGEDSHGKSPDDLSAEQVQAAVEQALNMRKWSEQNLWRLENGNAQP